MIDISSLTPLQATVALLIERSGDKGRRVCELCVETDSQKGAISKVLRRLLDCGIVIKNSGDVARYYAPMDSTRSTMDSTRSTVDSTRSTVDSTRSTVDSPNSPRTCRRPQVNLTLTELNLSNLREPAPQASENAERSDSISLTTQHMRPTKTCEMIPMYDAFVRYVHILYTLTCEHTTKEKRVNDFVLHCFLPNAIVMIL
jgi:hypothetical protein